MSLNTSHTPDGRGVLIYNGEMILVYIKDVCLQFEGNDPSFKGKKNGNLYLTSHRIIFINRESSHFRSFSMPFHCMRNVELMQPTFGANYLKGVALSQPGGNWTGEATWKLSFYKGGCIVFGQALLKAVDMAQQSRPCDAPPPYAPPPGSFFAAPPSYYLPQNGLYNGFQAPLNTFPDRPPAENVFVYEAPPPYGGIGPNQPPGSHGATPPYASAPQFGPGNAPPPPGFYQAGPLPTKQ